MLMEDLLLVGEADPKETLLPIGPGEVVIGTVPEWLRPWMPSDSFARELRERYAKRKEIFHSQGSEAPANDIELEFIQLVADARNAVFKAGLHRHLADSGILDASYLSVRENWAITYVPAS